MTLVKKAQSLRNAGDALTFIKAKKWKCRRHEFKTF